MGIIDTDTGEDKWVPNVDFGTYEYFDFMTKEGAQAWVAEIEKLFGICGTLVDFDGSAGPDDPMTVIVERSAVAIQMSQLTKKFGGYFHGS